MKYLIDLLILILNSLFHYPNSFLGWVRKKQRHIKRSEDFIKYFNYQKFLHINLFKSQNLLVDISIQNLPDNKRILFEARINSFG